MDYLNMLYDIRASFAGVLGISLNIILAMTLLAKPLSVTSLMVLHWYAQPPDWGGELAVTFRDWDDIIR